ncbi:Peptidase C1B, bleomycin hydrolase [Metarhizium album ARSEF 1941]|uniref:Cysteine proteinase 1, mitochondrial n=1 Tax=Metarhizium album (strain ARSEF 1941) TaxID=1081103 RepID=A0A0B2WLB6_METAS|nr:Peptidase C1B, bleomycin hydrolase [Metarhizium album ARSEF 1941]KHN94252.1 Peptidase C1B, bleomycin hydrolase [Metarhizium album ARSEF 1941]
MGAQQSRPSASRAHDEAVVDGLRKMRLERAEGSGEENEKSGGFAREAEPLPLDAVSRLPRTILEDPQNRLALSTLSSANPRTALTSRASKIANLHVFNTRIPFEGAPITNQRSSGRCWLFASTNVFRVAMMQRYSLDSFELSQGYLYYYDKLEKTNWFLEQIIDTCGEDLEGRLVQRLLDDLISDGGQWDMAYNLVDKYGLVPQTLYPDSWNAQNSSILNTVLKTKLRECALRLRRAIAAGQAPGVISAMKILYMQDVQKIVTLLLGPTPNPTEEFTWTYADKDNRVHSLAITPKDFAKNITSSGFQINANTISDMVSLVNDPRNDFMTRLTVDRLGNVVGGRDVTYINVDMRTLKQACVRMIRAGMPVFFGCDVGKFSDKSSGVMDLHVSDYEVGIGTDLLGMTKEQRLRAGESLMTHAMVLTAVHLDDKTGQPVRWRVQNSWGSENVGDKGWFVMTDEWMDEFVYQAVVDRRFLSKQVRDVAGQEPTVLPLWDPMGSLA